MKKRCLIAIVLLTMLFLLVACGSSAGASVFENPKATVTECLFDAAVDGGKISVHNGTLMGVTKLTNAQLETALSVIAKTVQGEQWVVGDIFRAQLMANKGAATVFEAVNNTNHWVYSLSGKTLTKASAPYSGSQEYGILTVAHPTGHSYLYYIAIDD